jgi:hypothetical protein
MRVVNQPLSRHDYPSSPTLLPSERGEGSSPRGVAFHQGVWKTASQPPCHVLFVPWRWPLRVILPCACSSVHTEEE